MEFPEIESDVAMETVPEITLTNGGLFISALDSEYSRLVLSGISVGGHTNPVGLSHCGLIFLEQPAKILSIIEGKISGRIPSDYPVNIALLEYVKGVIEQEYPTDDEREQLSAFCYAADYLRIAILGCMIAPLRWYLGGYQHNFFVRNVRTPYPRKFTRAFARATLGMPYVAVNVQELLKEGLARMLRAIPGRGSDTYVSRMWCSELVARFYGLNHPCSIMPSQFASVAEDDAVIGSDLFESEVPLSICFDPTSEQGRFDGLIKAALWCGSLYDATLRVPPKD
jgi:hypothetical protein